MNLPDFQFITDRSSSNRFKQENPSRLWTSIPLDAISQLFWINDLDAVLQPIQLSTLPRKEHWASPETLAG